VDKLLAEKMDIGERNVSSSKNSYVQNAMKKGKTLEFPIWSLAKVQLLHQGR
jgi:hypothetical protein